MSGGLLQRGRRILLQMRVVTLSKMLGDGPWLWAATGRLQAANGLEPPALPWYAEPTDQTTLTIAYWREKGKPGFYNRHWRKRARYARHVLKGNDGH